MNRGLKTLGAFLGILAIPSAVWYAIFAFLRSQDNYYWDRPIDYLMFGFFALLGTMAFFGALAGLLNLWSWIYENTKNGETDDATALRQNRNH